MPGEMNQEDLRLLLHLHQAVCFQSRGDTQEKSLSLSPSPALEPRLSNFTGEGRMPLRGRVSDLLQKEVISFSSKYGEV